MLNALKAINRFEAPGGNVYNFKFNLNPAKYSASGFYQITNTTWRGIAPQAGIDLSKYPTAISAPRSIQQDAAAALFQNRGFADWSRNTQLTSYIAQNGGASNFGIVSGSGGSGNYGGGGSGNAILTGTGPGGTSNGVDLGAGVNGNGATMTMENYPNPSAPVYSSTAAAGYSSAPSGGYQAGGGSSYTGGSLTNSSSVYGGLGGALAGGVGGLLGGSGGLLGGGKSSSPGFWSALTATIGDWSLRVAIVVLGIVLIGVAVMALVREETARA